MRHLCISLPSTSSASSSSSKPKSSSSSSSNEAADGRPGPRAKSLLMEVVADVRAKNDNGVPTKVDGCTCVWRCTCKSCTEWCCTDLLLCTAVLGANAWSRVGIVRAAASNSQDGVDVTDERCRCSECCCLCLFMLLYLFLVKKGAISLPLDFYSNKNFGTIISSSRLDVMVVVEALMRREAMMDVRDGW